jgi:hypothetical protein
MNKNIWGFLLCLLVLLISCGPEEVTNPDSNNNSDEVSSDSNNYTIKQAVSKKRGIGYNTVYAADFKELGKKG